ncbi:PRC-barrel domain-containing protein [Aquamicrobium sp. LC103]|uniref:PRC-barrel domain-containing protein n=1 Tax=Aquamicrobium sp. LC103 TaxID=1120658 RepID=UPI00063ED01D|nr:PRC-barrel domain-containing protein [Aquamicrobium sp. LC103]TKT75314.1 PRC-barrel domain containing protein [Aquamicrobium sp. LC103]
MIRNLLATTAIATLVASGAYAQSTTPAPMAPTESAPETPQVKRAQGHLASNIIGETVYNGTGEGAQNIGKVNDIVLSPEGEMQAVVIGVGGFLGVGTKNVALEYNLVEWSEIDGDEFLVVEATPEALKALPDFDKTAYQPMPADADVSETKPATAEDLANAPAEPADQGAMTDDTAADTGAPTNNDMAAAPDDAAPADDNMAAAPTDNAAPADNQAPADNGVAVAPPADDSSPTPTDDTAAATTDEEATDQTQTSAIDRSTLTEVDEASISSDQLVGTTVYGADDENIGSINDVVLSQDGNVEAVIVDVGGFLGIGAKPVAVGMENLAFMSDADDKMYLYTEFDKEQLEAQPEYDEATFAEQRDQQLLTAPAEPAQ